MTTPRCEAVAVAERLAELAEGQRQLTAAVRALTVSLKAVMSERPPSSLRAVRSGSRTALVTVLAASVGATAFNAREVTERASLLDGELRAALQAAGLGTARQLGVWLKSIEGVAITGLRLERLGVDNQGCVWRFAAA